MHRNPSSFSVIRAKSREVTLSECGFLSGPVSDNPVSQDLDKQAVIMSNPLVLCVVRGIRKTAA